MVNEYEHYNDDRVTTRMNHEKKMITLLDVRCSDNNKVTKMATDHEDDHCQITIIIIITYISLGNPNVYILTSTVNILCKWQL